MAWGRGRGVAFVVGAALAVVPVAALAASDADLQRRVEKRLLQAGFDRRADVTVEVDSGVVRLTGITTSWADQREAERLARKEAKTVVNVLEVVPEEPRSDAAIREDVEQYCFELIREAELLWDATRRPLGRSWPHGWPPAGPTGLRRRTMIDDKT